MVTTEHETDSHDLCKSVYFLFISGSYIPEVGLRETVLAYWNTINNLENNNNNNMREYIKFVHL